MDYQQRQASITVGECTYTGSQEQPVDLVLTLPDYCPDIQSILKCFITPAVQAANLLGDRLEVSGNLQIRLLYLSPNSTEIRCFESTSPFSSSLPAKTPDGTGAAQVHTTLEYLNCRATSPRRLDLHGAVSIHARVWNRVEIPYLQNIEGEDTAQSSVDTELITCSGLFSQQFTVEELLSLGSGKPDAEQILRTEGTLLTDTVDPDGNGQVLVQGRLRLCVLYRTDLASGVPEKMEYELPFRQQLPCSTGEVQVQLELRSLSVQPQADSAGENSQLRAEAKISAMVRCLETQTVSLLTDAYSRSMEVTLEQEQHSFATAVTQLTDTAVEKQTLSFAEAGISKVLDLWCEIPMCSTSASADALCWSGAYTLCLLGWNREGVPFYREQSCHFQQEKRLPAKTSFQCDGAAALENISYHLADGDAVQVRLELRLHAAVTDTERKSYLTNLIPHPDLPRVKGENVALLLYYAQSGESLWQIAKTHAADLAEIQAENDLQTLVLDQPRMLLIPV